MGVLNAILTLVMAVSVAAFLITGTLFFMSATVMLEKVSDMFGKVGAIAIPIGGSKKPPIAGSNSTPV